MNPNICIVAVLGLIGCGTKELPSGPTGSTPNFPYSIGASCESAYAAEIGRNGRLLAQPPLSGPTDYVLFEGLSDRRAATITYKCVGSRIQLHLISVSFRDESSAQRYRQRQKKNLEAQLGRSCRLYDTLAASDLKRLAGQAPERLREIENTDHWAVANDYTVTLQIGFDVHRGTWRVDQMAAPEGLTCRAA